MLTAALAMVGTLGPALSPSPDPVPSLQVAATSTCDYLIIAAHNPTDRTIRITPTTDGDVEPPIKLKPGDDVPINLPARSGLQAGLTVEGAKIGPWAWRPPEGCEDTPAYRFARPTRSSDVAVLPQPRHRLQHTAPTWVVFTFFLGASVLVVGASALTWFSFKSRPKGRHRQPALPIREQVSARVQLFAVRRYLLRRGRPEEG